MGLSPLGNLLNGAVKRVGIGRQVSAAFIVDRANKVLVSVLPEGKSNDAQGLSYADGILTIGVTTGAVKDFLQQEEETLLQQLQELLGGSHIKQVRYRLKPRRV